MLRSMYVKWRAKQLSELGVGPFSSRAVTALFHGCCADCSKPLSDYTIFLNGLVVRSSGATFLCSECRKLPAPLPREALLRGGVNRFEVIVSMMKFRMLMNLRDIELVLSLRANYAKLQFRNTHAEAFNVRRQFSFQDLLYANDPLYFSRQPSSVESVYGNLRALGNCGECSAQWPWDETKPRNGPLNSCWYCGCPHNAQWNMRTTLQAELMDLANWTSG